MGLYTPILKNITISYDWDPIPPEPIILGLPQYTKGTTINVFITSGSSYVDPNTIVEYKIEGALSSNFNASDIFDNDGQVITDESHITSGTTLVFVKHSPSSVQGVYLETDYLKTTNYFTNGSGFTCNLINLATPIPAGLGIAGSNQVVVDYTRSAWTGQYYDFFTGLNDTTRYYYRSFSRTQAGTINSGTSYVYSTQDDIVDTLKWVNPTGKEFWRGGTIQKLLWQAEDATSGLADLKTTLSYSRDSGQTWDYLTSGTLLSKNLISNEQSTSVDNHRIYTKYDISSIVSAIPTNSSIDWYHHPLASGTSSFSEKEIYFEKPLPSSETAMLLTYYTFGTYNWTLPTNLDGSQWRLKLHIEDNVGNVRESAMTDDFTVMTPIDKLTDIFKKEPGTNTANLLDTFGNSIDDTTNTIIDTYNSISYDGEQNDDLTEQGSAFNLERFYCEPDSEYRERIKQETRIANTKPAMEKYLSLYTSFGNLNLEINDWMGGIEDKCFFTDYSYANYIDRITSGTSLDQDSYVFDVWIRPTRYDADTYTKIADAVTRTRPVSSTPYVRVLSGEAYGTFKYGTGHKYGASEF